MMDALVRKIPSIGTAPALPNSRSQTLEKRKKALILASKHEQEC